MGLMSVLARDMVEVRMMGFRVFIPTTRTSALDMSEEGVSLTFPGELVT